MSNSPRRYTASRLKDILRSQGRMQNWVAHHVGISEATLSRTVSGERTVSEEVAQQISDVIGVPLFLAFDVTIGRKIGRPAKTASQSVETDVEESVAA